MFNFIVSFCCLVVGVMLLVSCRQKDGGKMHPSNLTAGCLGLIASMLFFASFVADSSGGYPANRDNLVTNAVYEIVSSSSSVADGKIISLLREPDGAPRLFAFKEGEIRTGDGGKFFKAVIEGGKIKLVPLDVPRPEPTP